MREGKAHRFHTVVSHAEHTARLMRQALDTDTDPEAVLTHIVGEMTDDELTRLSAYDLMCRGRYGLTCRGWRADHATVLSPPSIAVSRCFNR